MDTLHPHSNLIDAAGGTAEVARLCEITQPSVSDWRKTGIPKARLMFLRLVRPDVFGEPKRKRQERKAKEIVSERQAA